MLQTAAFTDFRNFIKRRIAKAQYRVGTTWYNAPIVETVITSAGVVRVKSQIAHGAASFSKISRSCGKWDSRDLRTAK